MMVTQWLPGRYTYNFRDPPLHYLKFFYTLAPPIIPISRMMFRPEIMWNPSQFGITFPSNYPQTWTEVLMEYKMYGESSQDAPKRNIKICPSLIHITSYNFMKTIPKGKP